MKNKIKEFLKEKNIKITTVVQEIGLSRSYFYDLMNGESVPSLITARKIADVLDVRLDELFPEENFNQEKVH